MSSYKFNKYYLYVIPTLYDQTILVSLQVKHYSMISNNTGTWVPDFNIIRTFPLRFPTFFIPSINVRFHITILISKSSQGPIR